MNGMWGYKVVDTNYKDTKTLIHYLVKTAGLGANLLLNIGPQPNGELPAVALQRLREIGEWMQTYGETIYGTEGSAFKADWGTSTTKGKRLFVHILTPESTDIFVPVSGKVKKAVMFTDRSRKVKYSRSKEGITLHLDEIPQDIDFVVELETA